MKFLRNKYFISKQGFTLIELLVVLGVLGILAAGVMVTLNPQGQLQKARDAQRKGDLQKIVVALEQYFNDNGKYPPSGSGACGCVSNPGYGVNCNRRSTDAAPWIPELDANYTPSLPVDPVNTSDANPPTVDDSFKYAYTVSCDGQRYDLITQLEFDGDPQRCEAKQYMSTANDGSQAPWDCGSGGAVTQFLYDTPN